MNFWSEQKMHTASIDRWIVTIAFYQPHTHLQYAFFKLCFVLTTNNNNQRTPIWTGKRHVVWFIILVYVQYIA